MGLTRHAGIDVEFLRDELLRIVTVAMAERGDGSATDYQSTIIGQRLQALIEGQNRTVA